MHFTSFALLLPLLASAHPGHSRSFGRTAHPRQATKPDTVDVSARGHLDAVQHLRRNIERGHESQKSSRRKRSSCQLVKSDLTTGSGNSSTAGQSGSASPSSTASSNGNSNGNNLIAWLFPLQGPSSWTTTVDSSSALSFSGALTPLTAGKLPPTSAAPDGQQGLTAFFPGGTFGLSSANNQGFSFYTEGQHNGVNVQGATEVLLSYSVYFPDNFDFVKGGKLPGLYGGTSLTAAKSCSGGRQDDRSDCWSARMMFRTNGMGELYNYFPTSATQPSGYCSTPPLSVCNPQFGDSIGRGSFTFPTGQWTTVAQRVKLNDVGQSNGEQELFVNGQSILTVPNLQIAVVDGTNIYGIMAQTFFGGSDSSWANPNDQSAWFKDWSLTVLA